MTEPQNVEILDIDSIINRLLAARTSKPGKIITLK